MVNKQQYRTLFISFIMSLSILLSYAQKSYTNDFFSVVIPNDYNRNVNSEFESGENDVKKTPNGCMLVASFRKQNAKKEDTNYLVLDIQKHNGDYNKSIYKIMFLFKRDGAKIDSMTIGDHKVYRGRFYESHPSTNAYSHYNYSVIDNHIVSLTIAATHAADTAEMTRYATRIFETFKLLKPIN